MRTIIYICLLFTYSCSTSQEMKLIYVGDPMCSWCYGFAPQLEKIVESLDPGTDLEVVNGGLRPYYDATMLSMKDFLTHHWQDVNRASGQEFRYDILERQDLKYDTEPPARAVVCVRQMSPKHEMKFFKACQRGFYYHNLDMNQAASYHQILDELELDTAEFDRLFHSADMKEKVKLDFQRAKELGVNSFPTVLFQYGEKISVVAEGYKDSETILERIKAVSQ